MIKVVIAILLLALSMFYIQATADAYHPPVALITWIYEIAVSNPHSFSPTPVHPAEWMYWIKTATDKLPDIYGAGFRVLFAYNLGI